MVLLPKDAKALGPLEQSLNPKSFSAFVGAAQQRKVMVYLPAFRLESGFELTPQLKKLGMATAFCDDTRFTDFSGMTGAKDLCISAVVHKAFVEVNELGTEAAAATAVVMAQITAVEMPPPLFRADHPFLFAIRDTRTGALLFLGRLVDPTPA